MSNAAESESKPEQLVGPQPDDAHFLAPGQGAQHALFPGVTIETAAGEQLMLSVVNLEPGSVVPEHSHPHEQLGFLISGRLEFTIGGLTRLLQPGDMWRIPGGVPHKVVTLDAPAVALDFFHPIREDYL